MSVSWGCSLWKGTNITNGVDQGDVLSSELFNIYALGNIKNYVLQIANALIICLWTFN